MAEKDEIADKIREAEKEQAAKAPASPKAAPTASFFDRVGTAYAKQFKLTGEIIKDIPGFTLDSLILATPLAIGIPIVGIDPALMSGGFMAGKYLAMKKNKEKVTYRAIARRGAAGAVLGGLMHYLFAGVKYLGDLVGAATKPVYGTISKGLFNLATYPPFVWTDDRVMNVLTGQPIHEGKEFWKYNNGLVKKLYPITAANNMFVPLEYQIGVGGAVSALYSYLTAGQQKKEQEKGKEADVIPIDKNKKEYEASKAEARKAA